MNKLREIYETKVKILSENKDKNVMGVSVPFIQADEKNQNGRSYPKALLQREIARVQSSVKKGSFVGSGDHPVSGLADIATASHIVTALSLDEKGQGIAELRILPTERGKTIQTLIRNNATLGVSCRGFGTVGKDGRVADDYKLVGLDVVMNPSFKNAVFDKSNIFESAEFEEEERNEGLEKAINELEKESFLGAVESGFKGTEKEWSEKYGSNLREMMGLPVNDEKTSVEKLTEAQISKRIFSYYQEAVQAGYRGDFNAWKTAYPRLVEMAGEVKVVEKKEEPKEAFKSKATWSEIVQSGFRGTKAEFEEKYPDISIIELEAPKKIVAEKILTEKTLKQEGARIFTELMKGNPNSSITLESVIRMLEKEEIVKADKRLRKQAIYIVNASLAGSGSAPSQEMLEKMVEDEIERLKEQRRLKREKNWECYRRLLD